MEKQYFTKLNGYTVKDEEVHERLTALGAAGVDTMGKQYFTKLNGYTVKDEEARARLKELEESGGGSSVETGTVNIDFGNFTYVLEDKTILIAFTQSGRGNVLSYSRYAYTSNNVTIENVHLNSPLVICFPIGGWSVSTTPNFQSGNTCIYYPSLIQGDTKNVYFSLDD